MCKSWTENSCRICLEHADAYNMLTEMYSLIKEKITLQEMFTTCTQLHISFDDALPQQICTTCCNELELSYQFIQKARCADRKLRLLDGDGGEFPSNKDPLEDSDAECNFEAAVIYNNDGSSNESDEDDKPLSDLINKAAKRRKQLIPSIGSDLMVEEPAHVPEECNILSDLTLSAEQQLFPKGRFKCKICSKLYFTLIGLKTHLDIHLSDRTNAKKKRARHSQRRKGVAKCKLNDEKNRSDFQCPNFRIKNEIDQSEEESASVHTDNKTQKAKQPKPKKMFPCPECGKQMISASKLRYHMVMHTGAKDYLCTMCPKAYSTIYALKHHMRAHTGERPYECKFCGDRFTRPTTLKSHMRRHTGERPYGCDICGKRFIQHSSMTTHMKLNHMAKTIPCPHCEKKYARQTDLNTHLLSHSGEKPFSCQLCPSRFIRQANLNKHMNQQHSGRVNKEAAIKSVRSTLQNSIAMDDVQNEAKPVRISGNVKMEPEVNHSITDPSLFITPNFAIDEELQPPVTRYPYQPVAFNGSARLEFDVPSLPPTDLGRWNWHTQV